MWLDVSVTAQEAFEVASIRKRESIDIAEVVPPMFSPGGRWSAQGVTLSLILRSVYELPSNRIVGMPSWAMSERFDLDARARGGTTLTQMQAMAKRLLAERFGLRAHWDHRVTEVYVLVRAKASGELGPGLRKASCQRTDLNRCGEEFTRASGGGMRLRFRDRPLADLLIISGARSEIGDPIVDRTELVGRFDIDLEFVPQSELSGQSALGTGLPYAAAFADQLGLRFERREELVDILVIDSVTRPSAN